VSVDLFRRRANEWRRLAAAARDPGDKIFWMGLVERWQAARQRCLRQVLLGDFNRPKQKHRPGRPSSREVQLSERGQRA
jgi:hypothetical protein